MLTAIIKAAFIPGSLPFLLLGVIAALFLLLLGKLIRPAVWLLASLVAFYVVLSLPAVSAALIGVLQPDVPPLVSASDAHGARVVVVLGNGVVTYEAHGHQVHQMLRRTTYAVLEGARLYDLVHPAWVVTSGGIPNALSQKAPEAMVLRDELVQLGVPASKILLEPDSRNTAEQIANVARLLNERNLNGRVVIVTTPAHAGRVSLLAREQGLDTVIASADALRYDNGVTGWRQWVPSAASLAGSESAMYEYLAIVQAWVIGGA